MVKKDKWTMTFAIVMISGILLCSITAALAEQYIRVQKNGVVYYFFDNRIDNITKQSAISSQRTGIMQTQPRKKISANELEPLIQEACQRHNLPSSLIKAMIRVESNFNAGATSPKGAQGLMQLMPETAEYLQVNNAYDVRENIWAGTRYLAMLLHKFNYSLPLALAAYNAGPQRVERYQGVPPIEETKYFVWNVCENFIKYTGIPVPSQ